MVGISIVSSQRELVLLSAGGLRHWKGKKAHLFRNEINLKQLFLAYCKMSRCVFFLYSNLFCVHIYT